MRPTYKEMDLFEAYDDLFDQYVETDLLNFSETMPELSSSDGFANFFEVPRWNRSDPVEAAPMPNWGVTTSKAWHQALRQLGQSPALPALQGSHTFVYPESRGTASTSDPGRVSLDELFIFGPQSSSQVSSSTPTTPTFSVPKRKTRFSQNCTQSIVHKIPAGVRKSARKPSLSPKMMRPSQYRAGYHDVWANQTEAAPDNSFNLRLPRNSIPTLPPHSTSILQQENSHDFLSNGQSFTISSSTSNEIEEPKHDFTNNSQYQLTPLSSPALNQNHSDRNSFHSITDPITTAYITHQINSEALSALQTPPPTQRLSMASWGPDATDNLDFAFPASPDLTNTQKPQHWWPAASAPQPSPSAYHSARPQSLDFITPAAGLGISCDSEMSRFTDPTAASTFSASSGNMYAYANMMPPTHQTNQQATTPPSRSPSTTPPPHRVTRHEGSKPRSTHHNHHRRKSSNSSSSGPRPASVGFVNFTPDDSRKILTGVAPSGSSKTKARREKEAAEKRRRLSLAATRAIIDAGGDLGELEREGLLCAEE